MFPKSVHLPDLATMSFEEAINASDFSGTSGEAPGLLFRHSSTPRRKHPALEVSTFVHGPGGVNIRSRALTGVETGAAEALRDAPAAILQKECTKTEIALRFCKKLFETLMLVRCTSESSGNLWISPESVFLTVCRNTLAYSMCSGSRMASMYQATSRSSARKRSDKRCVRSNSLVRSSRARMNPEGSAFSATSTAFKKKAPAVPCALRP